MNEILTLILAVIVFLLSLNNYIKAEKSLKRMKEQIEILRNVVKKNDS